MRKFLVAIAVVSMSFFSSCDKCKDKTCENAASCDKKTADCSNVCVNGGTSDASTGSCACPEFYNGGTCSNEVRNDYVGTYIGTSTETIDGFSFSEADTFQVALSGTDAKILALYDYSLIELTSNTAYKISKIDTVDGEVDRIVGTGTFSSSSFTIDATVSGTDQGDTYTGTLKFTGTKK
jgi:hypothetical protein